MSCEDLWNYINVRRNVLETQEVIYVTNINLHPQINHIIFHPEDNKYEMWDKNGNYFSFIALDFNVKREEYFGYSLKKTY